MQMMASKKHSYVCLANIVILEKLLLYYIVHTYVYIVCVYIHVFHEIYIVYVYICSSIVTTLIL